MKKANDGDIVRLKGDNHLNLYTVVGRERRPNGLLKIKNAYNERDVDNRNLIVVTRNGNRYDKNNQGGFIND